MLLVADAGAPLVVPLPYGPAEEVELEPVPVVMGRLELGRKVGSTELALARTLLLVSTGTDDSELLVGQMRGVVVVLRTTVE